MPSRESAAASLAGLFGLGGLEVREALGQRRAVLVDGVQCESGESSRVSQSLFRKGFPGVSGREKVVLRLARSREESLLASSADDAHGSGVLRAHFGSEPPPLPAVPPPQEGRRDVQSSAGRRPSPRPSCRSGHASALPWLPVKCRQ